MTNEQKTIQQLLQQLTLEEKILLLTGGSSFSSYPVERLGIPRIQYLDGGTGMNWEQLMSDWMDADTGTIREVLSNFNQPELLSPELQQIRQEFICLLKEHQCTDEQPGCYPPGILLGATWNPSVVHECGRALGMEARNYHVDILLGTPNVNLHRDPLNGRLFEGYSEDPCLICALAPELVQGVQETGVLANVKHFAANNLEAYRQGIDEHIPERVLRELYLPGFRACIVEGQADTLMTAYNKINGKACTENSWLIQEVLRKEWGFGDKLVISDWGAVYDQPAAIRAGNDIDMPGPRNEAPVYDALQSGSLTEEDINLAVSHMLKAILHTPAGKAAGLSEADHSGCSSADAPHWGAFQSLPEAAGRDFCIQAAYDAVTEGTVLLENRNDALPMPNGSRIAIIGKETRHFHDCGDGSARVYTDKTTSLYAELEQDREYSCQYMETMTENCLSGFDYAVLTAYVPGQEGRDRISLELPADQQMLIRSVIREGARTQTRIILLLNVCGPVDLRFCQNELDAVLCIFYPGMEGGHGVKDILTGRVNPSGKLPLTFPKRLEDCPTVLNRPSPDWTLNYGEGLYVGYRYYDKKDIEPMYPFGYGLSYTTFMISPLCSADECICSIDEEINLSCTLTNTGGRGGSEVVQLYVNDVVSTLEKPLRELKAFQKIYLEPGESTDITFRLPVQALASYDPFYKIWAVEPGEYRFYAGSSSRQLSEPVTLNIEVPSCYDFQPSTPFIRILDHPTAYPALLAACSTYGISESDFQGFAVYTPYFNTERVLNSVLGWRLSGEELEAAKERIYRLLSDIPSWKA